MKALPDGGLQGGEELRCRPLHSEHRLRRAEDKNKEAISGLPEIAV